MTKIWSKFNYLFVKDDKYFLYNSLTNSFGELDKNSYLAITNFKNSGNLDSLSQGLVDQLIAMKALVDNDQDEINKVRYAALARRFNDDRLILTINPTLACNFACPYCFEKNHPNVFMTDDVENKIIKFIKSHDKASSLDVTWFGGEPLLAFERIKSLTQKMQALKLNYKAGIITNGYLLTKEIIEQLSLLSIGSVQITIDGMSTLHNSRRCLKSGYPTFNTIVHNIDVLKKLRPEIFVTVRVNVDSSNDKDFIELYQFFKEKNYSNFNLSLSFVTDLSGCSLCDSIYSREQKARFIMGLRRKYQLDFGWIYPLSNRYECAIRNRNSVVIGPEGELYKCWNDVGDKEKIIGNIDGKVTNRNLLLRYLIGADPLDDVKCRECLLFPVCGGGCPYSRIKQEYEEKEVNDCPLIKDHMDDFLFVHAMCKK